MLDADTQSWGAGLAPHQPSECWVSLPHRSQGCLLLETQAPLGLRPETTQKSCGAGKEDGGGGGLSKQPPG